jgi:hypothetical protein
LDISVVQLLAASETTNAFSLQTPAFASSPTTGNTIFVCVTGEMGTSPGTLSLSDTEGNSYTCDLCNCYSSGATDVISNPASNNLPASTGFVSIWHAANITGGSSFKITATAGGSGAFAIDIAAAEVSGLGSSATVDVTKAGNGVASAGSPPAGSFSTTNANDIILVAMVGLGSATGASITMPTGFTQIGEFALSAKTCLGFGYEIVSSTQSSINPTFTTTHMNSATAIAVVFEAASAAPPMAVLIPSHMSGNTVQNRGGFVN